MSVGNNWAIIETDKLQISISTKVNLESPIMEAEAILALMNSLDKKRFVESGHEELFDIYLEQILEAVHNEAEWGGWFSNP